jgi:RNA polymerase sigma factor (sigma-70 family)
VDASRNNGGLGRGAAERVAAPKKSSPELDGLGLYLKEAGQIPLLDREREVALARELALSRRALRSLAGKISRSWGRRATLEIRGWPRPQEAWPLEEVDRFLEDLRRQAGSRRDARTAGILAEARKHERRLNRSRDQLVLANLRLVVHIAKKYPHPNISLPDLVQEGNLGLMKAVDKFDYKRGNRFTTYAYWWIKQAVERAIGNHGRTIRVPVHIQEKLRRIHGAAERLRRRREREPTAEEIALESGFTLPKVREVMSCARPVDPLEDPEKVRDHLHSAPDPHAVCPFEQVAKRQRRRRVEAALTPLAPQERKVIRLRFGLGCEMRPTLESVANAMDLSRERVRQIERRALHKIASRRGSRDLLGA